MHIQICFGSEGARAAVTVTPAQLRSILWNLHEASRPGTGASPYWASGPALYDVPGGSLEVAQGYKISHRSVGTERAILKFVSADAREVVRQEYTAEEAAVFRTMLDPSFDGWVGRAERTRHAISST